MIGPCLLKREQQRGCRHSHELHRGSRSNQSGLSCLSIHDRQALGPTLLAPMPSVGGRCSKSPSVSNVDQLLKLQLRKAPFACATKELVGNGFRALERHHLHPVDRDECPRSTQILSKKQIRAPGLSLASKILGQGLLQHGRARTREHLGLRRDARGSILRRSRRPTTSGTAASTGFWHRGPGPSPRAVALSMADLNVHRIGVLLRRRERPRKQRPRAP